MEAQSQGDENIFQGEAGRLVLEAFSKLFYAALLNVIGTIVLVVAVLAIMGSIFFDEAFWSQQGFEDYASLEELITELIMMIIPIIIIVIVFTVIVGYFYMKGGDLLRFASRISGSSLIAQVDTAASLIYYGGPPAPHRRPHYDNRGGTTTGPDSHYTLVHRPDNTGARDTEVGVRVRHARDTPRRGRVAERV